MQEELQMQGKEEYLQMFMLVLKNKMRTPRTQ
jgi:hypothetical protein